MKTSIEAIAADIQQQGFAFVPAGQMKDIMSSSALQGWEVFAESWNHLGEDRHMGDGGRYRRRLHAVFNVTDQYITRKPHQPHYQSLNHNTLNGGIERWFEPVTDSIGTGVINNSLMALCRSIFEKAAGEKVPSFQTEMHQFRIEPVPDSAGKPTPEGVHRDGVDWVCVLLVDRVNVDQGVTGIFSPDEKSLGNFTLSTPMDCVFLNDHRVLHGVTPINLVDPARRGYRDVLVLTFKNAPSL